MTLIPVREAARGKWKGILSALGVESRYLTGKNVPCPMCGDAKPRFRFTDRNADGMWICSNCGAHDGFTLLMMLRGQDFKQVAQDVERVLGVTPTDPKKPIASLAENRGAMRALWESARSIMDDDPVGIYLRRRTGVTAYPRVLRVVRDAIWTRGMPAMVAKVVDHDGRGVQVHRTFLTEDGLKAPIDSPRKMMPGETPYGYSVRLFDISDHLGIAEGIETALSAASLFGVPCWAALNAGNLEAWKPPAGVTRVTIFGDADYKYAGQASAFILARRLALAKFDVEVEIPPSKGLDWNEVHERQMEPA